MHFDILTPHDPYAHPTRPGHPERPHRTLAMRAALDRMSHPALRRMSPEPGSLEDAERLHDGRYLSSLAEPFGPGEPPRSLDGGDTVLGKDSLHEALSAMGGALGAVDRMAAGTSAGAVVACRPAGHHATRKAAMGFCLLGTAALAAVHARAAHGMRVAVLDFDLHHGNGTEELLENEKDVLFVSSQEAGIWPGSGSDGTGGSFRHLVNMSLPVGSGSETFRSRWTGALEVVSDFKPDLIVVSAGFDTHGNDPLSRLDVRLDDYAWIGAEIGALAEKLGASTLSIVEGGYDLAVLRDGLTRYLVPLIEHACGGAVSLSSEPVVLPGPLASAYLVGSTRVVTSGDARFSCSKMNGRLWVQDNACGAYVYTPPDFLRLVGRKPLAELAEAFNAAGGVDVDALIDFEMRAPRSGLGRHRPSPDYPAKHP